VVDGFFLPNLCRFTSFLVNGMERRNSGSSLHKETMEGVSFIKTLEGLSSLAFVEDKKK